MDVKEGSMKVVQVFPGKVWGGAEQYVLDLGSELAARGHSVSYVSRDSEAVASHLREDAVDCRALPFSWSLDLRTISGLAEIIRDADVVHVHSVKAVPIAVLAKKKSGSRARIVLTRHDAHRTPVNPLFRRFFRQLHRIVFVSGMTKRSWHGANRWFPEEKCVVVHNSIPPYADTAAESLREKFGIPASVPLIVFSGRVRESKGCGVLVDALGRIADRPFALVFLGACRPADYADKLMKAARAGGIADRVHFYGFTTHARALMRQADIGVAPSVFRDPFCLSNIEFQQGGVAIVTSNNGGQPEYVTDGVTGLLVNSGDAVQLAGAIASLLDDEALRKRIASAGHEYFNSHLSYGRFVDKIIDAYS